jgi:hypothetical protein
MDSACGVAAHTTLKFTTTYGRADIARARHVIKRIVIPRFPS